MSIPTNRLFTMAILKGPIPRVAAMSAFQCQSPSSFPSSTVALAATCNLKKRVNYNSKHVTSLISVTNSSVSVLLLLIHAFSPRPPFLHFCNFTQGSASVTLLPSLSFPRLLLHLAQSLFILPQSLFPLIVEIGAGSSRRGGGFGRSV